MVVNIGQLIGECKKLMGNYFLSWTAMTGYLKMRFRWWQSDGKQSRAINVSEGSADWI